LISLSSLNDIHAPLSLTSPLVIYVAPENFFPGCIIVADSYISAVFTEITGVWNNNNTETKARGE